MIIRTSKELGSLVREYRSLRNLTQANLAASVGVSRKWLVDLERGKRTVDLSLVFRTLHALGVEIDAQDATGRATANGVDLDELIRRSRVSHP